MSDSFYCFVKNHNSCSITLGQEIVTKGSKQVFEDALCFGGCLASIWLVPTGYQSEKNKIKMMSDIFKNIL